MAKSRKSKTPPLGDVLRSMKRRPLPKLALGEVTDAGGKEIPESAILYIDGDAGEIRIEHPDANRIAALICMGMMMLDTIEKSAAAIRQLD